MSYKFQSYLLKIFLIAVFTMQLMIFLLNGSVFVVVVVAEAEKRINAFFILWKEIVWFWRLNEQLNGTICFEHLSLIVNNETREREKNRVMYWLVIALKLAKLTPCYNSAKAFELAFGVWYLVCAYFSFVNDLKQSKVNGKLILTAIEKYVFGFDLNSISSTLYNYFFWFGQ